MSLKVLKVPGVLRIWRRSFLRTGWKVLSEVFRSIQHWVIFQRILRRSPFPPPVHLLFLLPVLPPFPPLEIHCLAIPHSAALRFLRR